MWTRIPEKKKKKKRRRRVANVSAISRIPTELCWKRVRLPRQWNMAPPASVISSLSKSWSVHCHCCGEGEEVNIPRGNFARGPNYNLHKNAARRRLFVEEGEEIARLPDFSPVLGKEAFLSPASCRIVYYENDASCNCRRWVLTIFRTSRPLSIGLARSECWSSVRVRLRDSPGNRRKLELN